MKKLCHTSSAAVNPSLFSGPSTKETRELKWRQYARCNKLHIRVRDDLDNFEQYRYLLEKAVCSWAQDQSLENYRKKVPLPELCTVENPTASDLVTFRPRLSRAGRPRLDPVMMFKAICLGEMYRLSDEELAYRCACDETYRLILDLQEGQRITRQSIWHYREIFTKYNCFEKIRYTHTRELEKEGVIPAQTPLIIDASFVEVPKQHNTREENQLIKEGKGHLLWNDNPHKKRQKDIDASWTKKNGISYFGFKLHALVEATSKCIIHCLTTTAKVHDSRMLEQMLGDDDKGREILGDSAYYGRNLLEIIESYGAIPVICEKGYRNKPLSEKQKKDNRKKSKTRCRIEHAFGFIENSMGGSIVRSIGLVRAAARQELTVFLYNIARAEQIKRLGIT